jgi:hypothetical protein
VNDRHCVMVLVWYDEFMANLIQTKIKSLGISLPVTARDRLLIWERARGIWRHKKGDPIRELAKMRREWNRKLPSLR